MFNNNHFGYLVFFCVVTFILSSLEPDILPQSKGKNTDWPELKFKHLTTKDGLSQNYVRVIAQDSRGFMWFGTSSGLQRYDGYNFTKYTHNPFDTTTLSGDAVRVIFEDSRGLLWINIEGSGYDILDPKTETVLRKPFTTDGNAGNIAEDKVGNIWISGSDYSNLPVTSRLFRISQERRSLTPWKIVSNNSCASSFSTQEKATRMS